jgi:hypothetical protein
VNVSDTDVKGQDSVIGLNNLEDCEQFLSEFFIPNNVLEGWSYMYEMFRFVGLWESVLKCSVEITNDEL